MVHPASGQVGTGSLTACLVSAVSMGFSVLGTLVTWQTHLSACANLGEDFGSRKTSLMCVCVMCPLD